MQRADSIRILLVSVALLAVAHTGEAATRKQIGSRTPIGFRSVAHTRIGPSVAGTPVCKFGVAGPAEDAISFIVLTPDDPVDKYYTLIDPTVSCSTCVGENAFEVRTVHVVMHIAADHCSLEVNVALFGAAGQGNCPTPDLFSLLYADEGFVLSSPDTGFIDFSLTLPETWQFSERSFLRLGFHDDGPGCAAASRPQIVFAEGCQSCGSWNDYDFDNVLDNLCLPDPYTIGSPVMYVDVARCYDAIPPSPVVDLDADSVSASAVRLVWTAPGDDGNLGQAARYEIRRAEFPLDQTNFTSGDSLTGLPTPGPVGTPEHYLATDLTESQLYYFAMRAIDEYGNGGPVLYTFSTTTASLPGKINDLTPIAANDGSVTLRWSIPLPNPNFATPVSVLIHASLAPITLSTFASTPLAEEAQVVVGPGDNQAFVFGGLAPSTHYWFALRARDGQGNLSPMSNLVAKWTRVGGPIAGAKGPAISVRQQPSRLPVEFFWEGVGEFGPTAAQQQIRIYDANGSWRNTLWLDSTPGGVARWNGLDYKGRLVSPGIYFIRFVTGSAHVDSRFVVLR